jgi:hypothetical protein
LDKTRFRQEVAIGEAEVALRNARREMRWKPGRDVAHLEKRKELGHPPQGYSLERFNDLIRKLLWDGGNEVYLYRFGPERYYVVRGAAEGGEWMVILSREGVVETAFPPDDIDDYLKKEKDGAPGKGGGDFKGVRWEGICEGF